MDEKMKSALEKLEDELRDIAANAKHHPHPGEMVGRLAAALLMPVGDDEDDTTGTA